MDGCVHSRAARRRSTGASVALALVLVLVPAACGERGSQDGTVTSPVPSPGSGPWDERDLAVYREALDVLEDYEARHQRFLAAGDATRAARHFYQDRARDWESSFAQLEQQERDGIRVARAPEVISNEPASIQVFQDGAADVTVRRCTDQADLGVTQDGHLLPAVHDQPVVQEVDVRRYENLTWRVGTFETTGRPCAG